MASEKESPANAFKRVLAVAMKTIAEDPELTVAFGNEHPSLSGNEAKLPQIGNELKAADVAIVIAIAIDIVAIADAIAIVAVVFVMIA